MDWNDSEDQADFRAEVKNFLEEAVPDRYKSDELGFASGFAWGEDRKSDDPEAVAAAAEWASALGGKGWIAPQWPAEYGGAGLSPMEQFIFNMEMTDANAPNVGGSGVSMLGPMLMVHGTDEQKAEHIPKILAGEVAWAQGYSEPGSGSDLASLQTRAIRDGDDYVINGQKIWTSGAHTADWFFVLVRTDPDAPKHRGISFVLMDAKAPGLSVRPLVNMAWSHVFNETFFEDVRVPVSNRVGEENRGWYVGMTLLDYERSNITGAVSARRTIDRLVKHANGDGKEQSRLSELGSIRHEIADRYIETEVMYNFSFRIISMQNRGLIPNYEASITKLYISETTQESARTALHAFGLYGNLWDEHDERSPAHALFTRRYVLDIPGTIAAGSSEIQRNIIATRGLGLPRS